MKKMALRPDSSLLLLAFSLIFPASNLAQDSTEATGWNDSPRSDWQLLLRNVNWKEIENLEKRARAYRQEGAIAHFEIHLSVNGPRYDALLIAAIEDIETLARLRHLELSPLHRQPARRRHDPEEALELGRP